jgi:hypothetical protein
MHRNLRTRRRMSCQKWTFSFVKQVRVVPNNFFIFIKWGSQAMSAGANPMNFWLI